MKRIKVILILLVLFWIILLFFVMASEPFVSSGSQSVDGIMAKYYEAMGGLENLRAWIGIKGTGKIVLVAQGGLEIPITVWFKIPDKQKIEMKIQGQTAIYASDGVHPWLWDPTRGYPEPAFMPEDQAREARNHADEYPFIDYEEKGHRLEFLGEELFEGKEYYRIRLIRNNGSQSDHYFDKEAGLETRILIRSVKEDKEIRQEYLLKDFRKVGWMTFPFQSETRINGSTVRLMVIESVELDPECDDSFFQMPGVKKPPDSKDGLLPTRN